MCGESKYEYILNDSTNEWEDNGTPLESNFVAQSAWDNYGEAARTKSIHQMDKIYK